MLETRAAAMEAEAVVGCLVLGGRRRMTDRVRLLIMVT
jgi:hypothetical protein